MMLIEAQEVLTDEVTELVDYASLGSLSAVLMEGRSLGAAAQGIEKPFAPGLGRFGKLLVSRDDLAELPTLSLDLEDGEFGKMNLEGPRQNDEIEDADGTLWRVRQWERLKHTGLWVCWLSTDERGVRS
jgi:hypothetical protein